MALALAADGGRRRARRPRRARRRVRRARHRAGRRACRRSLLCTSGTAADALPRRRRRGRPVRRADARAAPPTGRRSCTTSARRRRSTRRGSTAARRGGSTIRASPIDAAAALVASLAERRLVGRRPASTPGPVHLNLPFREPLVGRCSTTCLRRDGAARRGIAGRRQLAAPGRSTTLVAAASAAGAGVIVAGPWRRRSRTRWPRSPTALGWPVLAEPRSGCRHLPTAVGRVRRASLRVGAVRRRASPRRGAAPRRAAGVEGARPVARRLRRRAGAGRRLDPRWSTPTTASAVAPCAAHPTGAVRDAGRARCAGAGRPWLDGWLAAERRAQAAHRRTVLAADAG